MSQIKQQSQWNEWFITPSATVATRERASAVELTRLRSGQPSSEIVSEPAEVVRIRADQTLAKVNERVILLKDLVPLLAGEQERGMTSEEYESRLNRAIEMELTFQAAQARGLTLGKEQEQRLKKMAEDREATMREYAQTGFSWTSATSAQLEFEQRLTKALLLQQNLLATEGSLAPSSDPEAQAQYEQARIELLDRLKGQSTLVISRT
jgi:hypothetical protein